MTHQDTGHGPLVAFTGLAIASTGTLVSAALPLYPFVARDGALRLGVAGLLVALVLSTWHLGRRTRAHRAALGVGHSRISQEGALGLLAAGTGVVVITGMGTQVLSGALEPYLHGALVVLGLLFLVSVGLVYHLGGQLTWTGFAAATPVTAGLAFGAILLNSWPPAHAVSTVTLVAVGVDAFVFSQRWRRVVQVSMAHAGALPETFDRRHEWMAGRFLLLNALPTISLFVWPTPLAAHIALVGVFVDRMAFYQLALQHRTEVEVARVERMLGP